MEGNDKPVLVYSTCPTEKLANELAKLLVDARLAACVNIIPGMRSVYRWDGKIQTDSEVVFIAKTRSSLAEKAVAALVAAHPYDVPAALVIEVSGGNPVYAAWLLSETAEQGAV